MGAKVAPCTWPMPMQIYLCANSKRANLPNIIFNAHQTLPLYGNSPTKRMRIPNH